MAFTSLLQHEQKAMTSSQNATLQIPVFGKIHDLILIFRTSGGATATEAQVRAEVGTIRVTVNGRDIVNATAAKIYDLYEALGVNVGLNTGVGGALELNVGRLLLVDPVARDVLGWGTADVANIQVFVNALTLTNVASVQAYSSRENANFNFGAHAEYINYPQSYNAAGQHTVDTLPRNLGSSYLICMVDSGASGTITNGETRVNSITVRENVPTAVNQVALSNTRLQQPTGYFVYNFSDGGWKGQLPMDGVTDFRLLNTFSVAPGAAGYNVTPLTWVNAPKTA